MNIRLYQRWGPGAQKNKMCKVKNISIFFDIYIIDKKNKLKLIYLFIQKLRDSESINNF